MMKTKGMETLVNTFLWNIKYKDLDPAIWMAKYINQRYEHNSEQAYWFAWLYGNTYQLPTAWVLMNEFPDYELVSQDRIEAWNSANYKRLRYQTDTKWNKGHLPAMYASYRKFIGDFQEKKFHSLLKDNEYDSFDSVWDGVMSLHKFGRYGSWFYIQQLKHTCGLQVESRTLKLSDYEGSRSHRNGLLLSMGKEDWIDKKLTASEYASLESVCQEVLQEVKRRDPTANDEGMVDAFALETVLCQVKKYYREHHGRYLGYYLDRQAEEIMQAEKDGWYGMDWNMAWQAREETLVPALNKRTGVCKEKFLTYPRQGILERVEWLTSSPVEEENFMESLLT